MNYTIEKKTEIKTTKSTSTICTAQLEFDQMVMNIRHYLRMNVKAWNKNLSVNEFAGCKVTTDENVKDGRVALFKNGKIVALVTVAE